MPSPYRIKLAGWTIIFVMPLAILGALESGARLLGRPAAIAPELAGPPAWLDRNVLVKESRWIELLSASPRDLANYYRTYRWDRYLFYRLQPGLDLPLTDVTAPEPIRGRTRWIFHTNSLGFNSIETPFAKPRHTFRIVTLGDSSTFGWGVDREKIYPDLLGRILRERHPGVAIEVVNLGVCGYTSLQGLVLMRSDALRYDPDVVTLSYGSNDFSRVPEPFDVVYRRNLGWSGALREALSWSRAYQIGAAWLTRARDSRAGGAEDWVLNVGPEKGRDNLVAMVSLAREHGIDPIFVTNCVPAGMAEPIRTAATERGVPLIDTQAVLEGSLGRLGGDRRFAEAISYYRGLYGDDMMNEYPWLSVYLSDECHPNIIGHRLIADALAPLVESTTSFKRFVSATR